MNKRMNRRMNRNTPRSMRQPIGYQQRKRKVRFMRILLVIAIIGLLGLGAIVGIKSVVAGEKIDPFAYFSEFVETQKNMVLNDTRVAWEDPVYIEGDDIYIDAYWFNAYIDDRVYYDANEQVLTLTNLKEVIRVYPLEQYMTVNEEVTQEMIDVKLKKNKLYIHEDYLEETYAFDVQQGKDKTLVIATTNEVGSEEAEVKLSGAIRTHADIQSPEIDKVARGEKVRVYDQVGRHVRVRNENGWIGYLPDVCIERTGEVAILEAKTYEAQPIAHPLNDKVKLIWDQMTVRITGDWTSSKYTNIQGANVISPTWFEFADSDGLLIDRGTQAYVEEARKKNLQVWPLISHNFAEPQHTREILTSTAKRQYVIDQLLGYVTQYDVEGINVDIENVQPDFSAEWVQFMRELYPQMQAIGKTVSVDIYMPSAWSTHYERAKISEVVDYFMVMAYDQHWAGSEQAGPTAGLSWVKEGIQANLKEVPAEKLVLGIPFFARIWQESAEGLRSKAYSMAEAERIAKAWGTEAYYDEEHQQTYRQYQDDEWFYQAWIEDAETVAKRIALIEAYDLAGYAGWKLGLENKEVWSILEKMK